MKKITFLLFTLSSSLFISLCSAQTGTWALTKTPAPQWGNGQMLVLTDGTVICHNYAGGGYGRGWSRLTPDSTGSYANGTWSTIANMHDDRADFASQVLPSGKVWVAGGEYGVGDTTSEVYDPVSDTWTYCGAIPTGWAFVDAPSELLYNGDIIAAPYMGSNPTYNTLLWSPVTNSYTIGPNTFYHHQETTWLKLPDSTVLFIGLSTTRSSRYVPQTNSWINDDTLPVYVDKLSEEGQASMLPNGNAIFFGAG
ncbi:MAG TPA: kelch repeat-containing protein, partial [Bacteroidia bacterium]|nr:kelch repeat-containing protein [Bacteroidia bacterium]